MLILGYYDETTTSMSCKLFFVSFSIRLQVVSEYKYIVVTYLCNAFENYTHYLQYLCICANTSELNRTEEKWSITKWGHFSSQHSKNLTKSKENHRWLAKLLTWLWLYEFHSFHFSLLNSYLFQSCYVLSSKPAFLFVPIRFLFMHILLVVFLLLPVGITNQLAAE